MAGARLLVGNAQVKQQNLTDDLDKLSDFAALRLCVFARIEGFRWSKSSCNAEPQSRKAAKDRLRFWLARAGLLLDVLYVAFSPQQVLDTEKRFERVLPEGRADTEEDCHYDPAQQRFDIVFSSLYPAVPGVLKILV